MKSNIFFVVITFLIVFNLFSVCSWASGQKVGIIYTEKHETSRDVSKWWMNGLRSKGIDVEKFDSIEFSELIDNLEQYKVLIFALHYNVNREIDTDKFRDILLSWVKRGGVLFFTGKFTEPDIDLINAMGEQFTVKANRLKNPVSMIVKTEHPLVKGIKTLGSQIGYLTEYAPGYTVIAESEGHEVGYIFQEVEKGLVFITSAWVDDQYQGIVTNMLSYTSASVK